MYCLLPLSFPAFPARISPHEYLVNLGYNSNEIMDANTIRELIIVVPALVLAITLHEVSHGYVANRLGDPTARFMGRLTLNPVKHVDPIGTIIMPLALYFFSGGRFVFGYAKPVPINPHNFKDPRKDMAISAAAGPVTNILLAIFSQLILAYLIIPAMNFISGGVSVAVLKPMGLMFHASIEINIILAVINLIPIPPLDGDRVLIGFLPHKMAVSYSRIERYGFLIVILLFITGIAHVIIYPVVALLYVLITSL
jgi:Zn-dependent protease